MDTREWLGFVGVMLACLGLVVGYVYLLHFRRARPAALGRFVAGMIMLIGIFGGIGAHDWVFPFIIAIPALLALKFQPSFVRLWYRNWDRRGPRE